MSTFTTSRLTFYQNIFEQNFGYTKKKFEDLEESKSLVTNSDIIIIEFDENSVKHHNHKNMFTMALYLLRIIARLVFGVKIIDLKLTNLSNSFKGKVGIKIGKSEKIIVLDCFSPTSEDFELTVDNKSIDDSTKISPINITMFSEHSEGDSSSSRIKQFETNLNEKIKDQLTKTFRVQSISNITKAKEKITDGTLDTIINNTIKNFADVKRLLSLIFQNNRLAFIRKEDYIKQFTNSRYIPAQTLNINGQEYILASYSLKSEHFKLVDQTDAYLTKLFWLLQGQPMDSFYSHTRWMFHKNI